LRRVRGSCVVVVPGEAQVARYGRQKQGIGAGPEYPYREEPEEAITESVLWLQALRKVVDRMGHDRITEVIRAGNAAAAQRMVRQALMNEA
jgi:hypothetical protein